MGEQVQAGVAAADKAQLCPWKAQGTAEGEGRAPSHQVMWDEGGGVTSGRPSGSCGTPCFRLEVPAQAGRTEQDKH